MELVDMLDLGSSAARRGGSTPFSRTGPLRTRGFLFGIRRAGVVELVDTLVSGTSAARRGGSSPFICT